MIIDDFIQTDEKVILWGTVYDYEWKKVTLKITDHFIYEQHSNGDIYIRDVRKIKYINLDSRKNSNYIEVDYGYNHIFVASEYCKTWVLAIKQSMCGSDK